VPRTGLHKSNAYISSENQGPMSLRQNGWGAVSCILCLRIAIAGIAARYTSLEIPQFFTLGIANLDPFSKYSRADGVLLCCFLGSLIL
jgi:hypothetical protein